MTNTLGQIVLFVFAKGVNKQTRFNVIDYKSAYNAILGRPWIHEMKAVPSTYHQTLKFPSPWGIQEIKSEQRVAREWYKITMKPQQQTIQQLQNQGDPKILDDYQLEEIVLDPGHPDRTVFIGTSLDPIIKEQLTSFLQDHADCFTWIPEDMVGIDPIVISHKLNIDPTFKPIKEKRRKFTPERNKVINNEVDNLLKTGKIREVKYPDWLANVMVIQKKEWEMESLH